MLGLGNKGKGKNGLQGGLCKNTIFALLTLDLNGLEAEALGTMVGKEVRIKGGKHHAI